MKSTPTKKSPVRKKSSPSLSRKPHHSNQNQELYCQQLYQNTPEAVVFLDRNDQVLDANDTFIKMFGYSLAELTAQRLNDLIVPGDLKNEANALSQKVARMENVHAETIRKRKDGSPVFVSVLGCAIKLGGKRIGVCGIYKDITIQKQTQDLIHESEVRYRTLVESANDIIYTADPAGHFVYANPMALQVTGYLEQEILGKKYLDLIPAEYQRATEVFYRSQLRTNTESTYYEFPILSKQGKTVWLGQHVQIIGERNRITGVQAVARDITDRKEAERALMESEQHLQTVISTVNDGITFSDEGGHFQIFNKTMERITGYSMDEANAGDFSALLYPDPTDRQRALDGLKNLLDKKEIREVESVIRTKSGEKRTLLTSTTHLEINDKKMFLNAYRDITLRKRAETALEESEARFRELYDDAPVGYHELDSEGRVVGVNRKELEMLGYPLEEMLGKHIWNFLEDPKTSEKSVRAKLSGTVSPKGSYERVFVRKDRTTFPALVDERINYNRRGEVTSIRTTLQDITERKQAELALGEAKDAAEAATIAKSQFLAVMSHEIRTPMNGVIGMTDLLLTTALSSEQREFVETVRRSGEALLAIINDILDFSKIESGKIELEQHPFEVNECIEEVFELLAPRALEKSLDLLYWVDPRVPSVVVGDKFRLRQILFNLAGNAIKFTERGEIFASVSVNWKVGNDCQLEFLVRDTGIGIPRDRIDRLFKAFSQVDSSTTRKYGGTGLGLAISSRLVELMGGKIWVESEEEKGTTFFFTIKIATPAETLTMPKVVVRGKVPELQNRRVLIVDDNTTNLQVLRLQCEYWGMLPRTSTSPDEALEWVRNGDPFDIAILDMLMPHMNGIQLALELRTIRSKESLPILLLSSSGVQDDELKKHSQLFFATVPKPLKQDQLFKHILNAFAGVNQPVQRTKTFSHHDVLLGRVMPLRILVAEDNETNQKLFIHMLHRLGYEGFVVSNGAEAIRELESRTYDLVFMDVHMPEMDGLDASRHIVNNWKAEERPRIIALTADAMQGDREKCIEAGMDDYLTKPTHIDEVRRVLEEWGANLNKQLSKSEPDNSRGKKNLRELIMMRFHDLGFDQDPVFLLEFITVALNDIHKRHDQLIEAFRTKDVKAFHYAAHALKGSSSNFGTTTFVELCQVMESSIIDGSFAGYEKVRDEFDLEYGKILLALQELKKNYSEKSSSL